MVNCIQSPGAWFSASGSLVYVEHYLEMRVYFKLVKLCFIEIIELTLWPYAFEYLEQKLK